MLSLSDRPSMRRLNYSLLQSARCTRGCPDQRSVKESRSLCNSSSKDLPMWIPHDDLQGVFKHQTTVWCSVNFATRGATASSTVSCWQDAYGTLFGCFGAASLCFWYHVVPLQRSTFWDSNDYIVFSFADAWMHVMLQRNGMQRMHISLSCSLLLRPNPACNVLCPAWFDKHDTLQDTNTAQIWP